MRTRMLLALSAAAALTLTGCSAGTTAPAAVPAAVAGLGAERIRVGLAFDTAGRGDNSFNDAAGAGLDRAKEELAVAATEVSPAADTDAARAAELHGLAESGHNPVIGIGFLYAPAIKQVAAQFPETTFAIVDDESFTADNVVSLVFAEEQGSYLVGAAAALKSRSGVVGFVGGVRTPLLQKFEAGFVAGAKQVDPDVTVRVRYLTAPPDFSGFGDPGKGEKVAARLLDGGADVIYAAAGASGTGALRAVAETRGATFIGVDSDQYKGADEALRPVILTSMLKRVDNAVFQQIQAFVKGDRKGTVRRFDLKTDGVGYAISNETAITPLRAELDRLRQRLYDGKVIVPTKP